MGRVQIEFGIKLLALSDAVVPRCACGRYVVWRSVYITRGISPPDVHPPSIAAVCGVVHCVVNCE